MAYQLRFESNALEVDKQIEGLLNALARQPKGKARPTVTVRSRQFPNADEKILKGICQRTFELSMDWADKDFDQQMVDSKWAWETNNPKNPTNRTRRKNGEVVTSPRDIVDTGALLQSKKRDPINSSITEFIWEDDVAELVHDGGRTKTGKLYPARPWTEPALNEIDEVINTIIKRGGR
jgi:hypothetical protein